MRTSAAATIRKQMPRMLRDVSSTVNRPASVAEPKPANRNAVKNNDRMTIARLCGVTSGGTQRAVIGKGGHHGLEHDEAVGATQHRFARPLGVGHQPDDVA